MSGDAGSVPAALAVKESACGGSTVARIERSETPLSRILVLAKGGTAQGAFVHPTLLSSFQPHCPDFISPLS